MSQGFLSRIVSLDEEYIAKQTHVREWIMAVLNEDSMMEDLSLSLKDGKILCRLVIALEPGAIQMYHDAEELPRHLMIENINTFLRTIRWVGVPNTHIFEPMDLYDCHNMRRVVDCMLYLQNLLLEKWTQRRDHEQGMHQETEPPTHTTHQQPGISSSSSSSVFRRPSFRVPLLPPQSRSKRKILWALVHEFSVCVVTPLAVGFALGFGIRLGRAFFTKSSLMSELLLLRFQKMLQP
eukprot:TRINITY_DN5681_c0_g1_i1.p1 TRINITY_DN5681_c0_g1~~TRINITY_DN5681_c0_g1_i1.p1  ORF type:complete len:237 (+),score=36.67 TRINITY_DN5681_c0_g1_i1:68-778(+)